jgi:hypothetical protein
MTPGNTRARLVLLGALLAAGVACSDDVSTPPDATGPDTRAPQPIDDLSLSYDSLTQDVVFTWTARRDDLARVRAARYDMRYGASFPFEWERSTRIVDPPAPLDAGTPQAYHLAGARRGRDVYASMRAVDAAGNESPSGAVAHVRLPGLSFHATCIDALSDRPIPGLDAVISSRSVDTRATGSDGRITLADLAGGTLGVLLRTGAAPSAYHTFNDSFTLERDVALTYEMIAFQPPDSPAFTSILELLNVANFSPGSRRIIRRWASYPVPWYAREFVNANGLDYRALTVQATERWNARVGFPMFAPAPSDPAVGVLLEFLPRSAMGSTNGVTEYTSDASGYPVHDRIRIVDDFADEARLHSVLLHELGHTIRLNHLGAGFIMYASQPLPSDVTDDEVRLVRLMLSLPNGTDLGKYDPDPPSR